MPVFDPARRALLLAPLAAPALAQERYPARPIRLIVPFPAGGPTDVYARLYAERLARELGATIVLENRGGAGGAIGAVEVMRARADGHTLLFGTASTHALYPIVQRQPQYTVADFTVIAQLGGGPLCWLANPSQPATLTAFMEAAKQRANPPLSYGSPGTGTLMHFATELLKQRAGNAPLTHVPYRGAAPAMNDLLGGTLALAVNTFGPALPLHEAGRARMLAVASAGRQGRAPDVPTLRETFGAVGFEAVLWHAVFAPARLPAEIAARLVVATNTALADPTFRATLDAAGIEAAPPGTPEEALAFIAGEAERYRPVIEGLRPELDA